MEFETGRLVIRRWNSGDLEEFIKHTSSVKVAEFAGWNPIHPDEADRILNKIIEKDEARAIVSKETQKPIGIIGVHTDPKRTSPRVKMITYSINEDQWGKGIMTEAVSALIKQVFTYTEIETLTVYHYPFNIGSKRVIEKCGFQFEGILRRASKIFNGNIYDDVCYSLSRDEYI